MAERLARLLCAWCCVALLAAVTAAAADHPTVEVSAAPAQCAVGDAVTVTVTWSWPSSWHAGKEPDPVSDFRDCFVTDAPPIVATRTGESERRSARLTLLAARSGAWALPRPSLTASGPQGAETVQASAVVVQVGTEAAPPKLPAPIALRVRPPLAAVDDHRWWWLGGGIALLVVGIALLVVLRHRAVQAAVILPAERFQAELRRLAAVADGKELGAGLSLALRRYAGEIYRFDGAGSTTREVASQLARTTHPEDEWRALVRLLERLDDLRWAAGELDAAAVRPVTDDATAWVAQVERRLAELAAQQAAGGKQPAASAPAGAAGAAR